MGKQNQTKFPLKLFAVVFILASLLPIIRRKFSPVKATFVVSDNSGTSRLWTHEKNLVAVFSNGQVVAWDWDTLDKQPLWRFSADSDRLVMCDKVHAAAVTNTGRKKLIFYDIEKGTKTSQTDVGWDDQAILPIQSPDKNTLVLVCTNPDKDGRSLYEMKAFNSKTGNTDFSVSVDVQTSETRFLGYAVSNTGKCAAAGSKNKRGWLTIFDLQQGKAVLQKEYDQTEEFTSAAFIPDGSQLFLTNRNGSVYGVDAISGEVKFCHTILNPDEKNPVTNDRSSQNIVISTDGKYVAAVMMERKVAVWGTQSGNLVFQGEPGHKLVGSIALSADGSLLASSDKRAGGSIQIWQIKK